jgi:hypothetical protein
MSGFLLGYSVSFPFDETGRPFHVDGITVIGQARTVGSAGGGANLLIMLNPGGIAAGREGAA